MSGGQCPPYGSPAYLMSFLRKEIKIGLSPETWMQYHLLIAKCQAETLTELERFQPIETSHRLEVVNVSLTWWIYSAKSRNRSTLWTI